MLKKLSIVIRRLICCCFIASYDLLASPIFTLEHIYININYLAGSPQQRLANYCGPITVSYMPA